MRAIVYYFNGSSRLFDFIVSIEHTNDNFLLIDSNKDTVLIPREHVEFIKIIN